MEARSFTRMSRILATSALVIAIASLSSQSAIPEPSDESFMVQFPPAAKKAADIPLYAYDPPIIFYDSPSPDKKYPAPPIKLGAYNRYKSRVLFGIVYDDKACLRDSFETMKTSAKCLKEHEKVSILEHHDWTWSGEGYKSGYKVKSSLTGDIGWVPGAAIILVIYTEDSYWYGIWERGSCYFFCDQIQFYAIERVIAGKELGVDTSQPHPYDNLEYRENGYTLARIDSFDFSDLDGDKRKEIRIREYSEGGQFYGDRGASTIEEWYHTLPEKYYLSFSSTTGIHCDDGNIQLLSVVVITSTSRPPRLRVKNSYYQEDLRGEGTRFIVTTYFSKSEDTYQFDTIYPFIGTASSSKDLAIFDNPSSLKGRPITPCKALLILDEGGTANDWYLATAPDGNTGWIQKKDIKLAQGISEYNYPRSFSSFKYWYESTFED